MVIIIIIIISVPFPLPSILPSFLAPSFLPPSFLHQLHQHHRYVGVVGVVVVGQLQEWTSRINSWNFCRSRKYDAFQKPKKFLESLISKVEKIREFSKERSQCNVWESVLAKIPGIFGLFATARFYNSKRHWRCAGCSVFMKGKIYLWKGSSPYER